VTALILQDHYGGELRRGLIDGISHYWNVLDDGREIDLTRRQFQALAVPADVQMRDRQYVLSFPETRTRYEHLRADVDRLLAAAV
jgi:hypothetical protein